MEYDNSRRCLPHNLAYPNYICERNAPLALSHGTRENPRGYPVGGTHSRASMEEPMIGTGPARRRIAVACARCRKRKIRCSGDPGNGTGCVNCRQAGVDPAGCQFHRVGSDAVHKVIDDRNMAYSLSGMASGMANAHNMMSIYSTGGNTAIYQRPMSAQQYQQLDTKPMCSPNWAIPYSDDTSPVDGYSLEQPQAYISQSTAVANTSMYPPPCRWTQPTAKTMQQGATYFDQGLHFPHTNHRLTTSSDISPLNTGLSSLHLSLPERPHPQQPLPQDSGVPLRQLPVPKASQTPNRNVVDQMQDARLRSAQAIGTSAVDSRASFSKPSLPWTNDSDNHINASVAIPTDAFTQVIAPAIPENAESRIGYLPNTTPTADDTTTTTTTTAPYPELDFSASGLPDVMSVPTSATNYSFVRESRQMARPSSQTNLYSYSPSPSSKRNSSSGESASDCALVSGHRYTPLNHSQLQSSPGTRSLHRESCQSRNVQLDRTSMGNLNSTY